jgi:cold shock CspA family protein
METPLQLEIQGFTPSSHVRELIEANLTKVEARFGRITSCRVSILAPGAHHRMGEPYAVSIRAALPNGREVNVGRVSRGNDRRQGDVNFAINDAFRRAVRQLRDQTRLLRGEVKLGQRQPVATIARIDRDGTHGYLTAEDGHEIYFHANSVLDGKFAVLRPGDRIGYHEETGEKGPQASTVRLLTRYRRKH